MNKANGTDYWRSLDQLADTAGFRKFLQQEFPDAALETANSLSRRKFLALMSASLAMAGLAGCRRPVEKIIPYIAQPEEIVPGIPRYYATTIPFGTSAYGVVVESHEGRPTKIEGNALHPSSLGRSSAHMQAEILNLYDPDRSKTVLLKGMKSSWDEFITFWQKKFVGFMENQGEGLAVLSESFSSPTLARLRGEFNRIFPKADFAVYEPISDENIMNGMSLGFQNGGKYRPEYRYEKAEVILSLDSDFLLTESESILAAGKFSEGRRITDQNSRMNRLYAVESNYTTTGAMADHRMRLPRGIIGSFAANLALELENQGLSTGFAHPAQDTTDYQLDRKWTRVLASDLIKHRGKCMIIGGRTLPANVHLLILALNRALGNLDTTVVLRRAEDTAFSESDRTFRLIGRMRAGEIDTLVMLGGNPYYNMHDLYKFNDALSGISHSIHIGLHANETADVAQWHLPQTHCLENWSDARAPDGTLSVIQPLIEPLFGGHSIVELLDLLCRGRDRRGYDIVRETWKGLLKGGNFERQWRKILHDGLFEASALPAENAENLLIPHEKIARIIKENPITSEKPTSRSLQLTLQPSPAVFDGRLANNGWLQELPHPITKLTWGNAATVSVATARELGLKKNDIVTITSNKSTIELPIWIVPGQADNTISVDLGFGRVMSGKVGNGIGVNAYGMRSSGESFFTGGINISKTGRTFRLASTQDHGSMNGRPIVREAAIDDFRNNPKFARKAVKHPPLRSIYPEHDYSHGYQWGMTVDLTACTGCNACVVACQSENNISVVGKARVMEGREMHWIRIDRYFTGDTDNPEIVFQPVNCQQCELAPCEHVCPVAATSHDQEGLNVMTYNRCIGTRYCSNNCPYKVRRFNFFNYTKNIPELVRLAQNPDVTTRSRGVMEKCTFCTQRINRAKIPARREDRKLRDGEIATACQQACPAGAITFGNINDPESEVSKSKRQDRNYELLAEFNTRPRNSFLARIRNPHPDLKGRNAPPSGEKEG